MISQEMRALVELVKSVKFIVEDERSIAQRTEKSAFDYTTQVDMRVQAYIESALKERYPDHQFMGEEGAPGQLDLGKPTWILDPIDGTTNLIHHYPQCAVSLGLMVDRQIVLGIVYNPFTGDLFTAERGRGAFYGDVPMNVSKIDALGESLINFGSGPYGKRRSAEDFQILGELFTKVQDIRRAGAAALELSYVAAGMTECFYERMLKPWDYAAGLLMVEEAGGRATTFSGEPIPVGEPSSIVITNGRIHEQMLAYTRRLV